MIPVHIGQAGRLFPATSTNLVKGDRNEAVLIETNGGIRQNERSDCLLVIPEICPLTIGITLPTESQLTTDLFFIDANSLTLDAWSLVSH